MYSLPINMVQVFSLLACITGDTAKVCICKMWHYYIWWHQSVAVTIKPVLESIWIVQPHKININILIEFSFIYYFFNHAKSKTHNCKRRQFYHPLYTWVHVIRCMEFNKPKLMFTHIFYLWNDNKKITNAMVCTCNVIFNDNLTTIPLTL